VGFEDDRKWVVKVDSGFYLMKNASETRKRQETPPKQPKNGRKWAIFLTETRVARPKEVRDG